MGKVRKANFQFLGWLALLQLAGEMAGLGVFLLCFDLFGTSDEFYTYGWFMLPLWLLWGLLTPRRARPGAKWTVGILAVWALLIGVLSVLLPEYRMLLCLPQIAAGAALAQLKPVHYGSALYFKIVEPAAIAAAHLLLPALLALGLYIGQRANTK